MKTITYILGLTLLVLSCTEELDLDYSNVRISKLLVDGRISTDTTAHTVKISRTVGYKAEDVSPEEGATITIFDGAKMIPLNETSAGIYQTDSSVYGEIGKSYTLNITLSDGSEYHAKTDINAVSPIDSINFQRESFSFTNEDHYLLYFYGQEPPERGNYYFWNLYLNDSLYNDTIDESRFESDDFVNGQYIYDFDIYWVDLEEVPWDTVDVKLEMLSIPEEYNTYLIELFSETSWRGGPFDPTPANISTNISNGAIGFFYGAAITRKSVTYIKPESENEN
jgi:hypothetical protein